MVNPEKQRLRNPDWKIWGPYLSNRQWGTVREDYSEDGYPWDNLTHDMARSKAYRWGEDGIAGISDNKQLLCFGLAFWNGKDTIIKERFFGLNPSEGNHGEDVKEYYYYIDNTPTHSYMKMLYKYPQQSFPYNELVEKNKALGKDQPEYELLDTEIFNDNRYFDIEIEYAKATEKEIFCKINVHNRSSSSEVLYVLPQAWFSNTWSWDGLTSKPKLYALNNHLVKAEHEELGNYYIYFKDCKDLLFCENETNSNRLYDFEDGVIYPKDGINDYLTKNTSTINPEREGTKVAGMYTLMMAPYESQEAWVQLSNSDSSFSNELMEDILAERRKEADTFYDFLQKKLVDKEEKKIQRQSLAGLLWSKQFYYFNVSQWLSGDKQQPEPPPVRNLGRNSRWQHFYASDIIVMPDKWEYPWFASWDTAFHSIPLCLVDIEFAKEQLLLLLHEWYMHPNGQIPGYEWEFNNVNPPVQAWVAWYIFEYDKNENENNGDYGFLKAVFNRLMINFTWWVNREDYAGSNIFEGGFLGLDNIAIIDRNTPLPLGGIIEQADGTSWMALYSLKMMRIAMELASQDAVYEDMATKFFEHFMYIAGALNKMGNSKMGLWDEDDRFFYDQIKFNNLEPIQLKVRSLVGLFPLLSIEIIPDKELIKYPEFRKRLNWFIKNKPELSSFVGCDDKKPDDKNHIFTLLNYSRLQGLINKMSDQDEFLSDYGIRSLSKIHFKKPFYLNLNGWNYSIEYAPSESISNMFGGNSNWRGPIWIPVNFLIVQSLIEFHKYYGEDFKFQLHKFNDEEYNLKEFADLLTNRLLSIFKLDNSGRRPSDQSYLSFAGDELFNQNILFYEYFNGENGCGLGASHQTGWAALVANLICSQNS